MVVMSWEAKSVLGCEIWPYWLTVYLEPDVLFNRCEVEQKEASVCNVTCHIYSITMLKHSFEVVLANFMVSFW